MGDPVPYWRSDPDYYSVRHEHRTEHLRRIECNRRIDARIDASSGDGSYAVLVTRREIF